MSKRQMEQVGEPFEIYNNPATGSSPPSWASSTVCRSRWSILRWAAFELAGEIRTTSLIESPAGAEVSLMMRPEEVTFDAEGERPRGTVESVTFLGSIVRVQVTVDGGRLTADLFNERLLQLPAAGDATQISFPAHACWVMV